MKHRIITAVTAAAVTLATSLLWSAGPTQAGFDPVIPRLDKPVVTVDEPVCTKKSSPLYGWCLPDYKPTFDEVGPPSYNASTRTATVILHIDDLSKRWSGEPVTTILRSSTHTIEDVVFRPWVNATAFAFGDTWILHYRDGHQYNDQSINILVADVDRGDTLEMEITANADVGNGTVRERTRSNNTDTHFSRF